MCHAQEISFSKDVIDGGDDNSGGKHVFIPPARSVFLAH